MERETIFSAPRVLLPNGVWLAPGAIRVRHGRIQELGEPAALHARSPGASRIELTGCALLPGLINAHAHLELSGLAGKIPREGDFGEWVRAVVRARSESSAEELEQAAIRGARLCLAGGATTVGDLDATGASERAWARRSASRFPRCVLFRELLDARNGQRTGRELARIAEPWARSEFLFSGLAPHAPHTVSTTLLESIARAAGDGTIALTTHWAETQAEGDWLESGRGPFAALLGESPRCSGLQLLQDAGVLGPQLALVHGNRASLEEIACVARSRATLVHCPGSHAYFRREPFALREWRAAGVAVALGTDSLASNSSLDMRLEMARFASAHPWLEARDVLDAATIQGARALGLGGRVGAIAPGAFADLLAIPAPETDAESCLKRLARGQFEVLGLWLGGSAVPLADRTPD